MSEELDQNRSVLARYTQSLGIDEPLAILERRVRGLHPVLRDVEFCHRWGGPILIADSWQPVFDRHPRCPQALILGGYSGHGVALSVYLADRKSTRLNSSHLVISYAVFCLKKKKKNS